MSEILNEFEKIDELEAVKELFSSKGFETKTELHNVKEISVLEVLAEYLGKDYGGNIIKAFVEKYKINMISHNRESRKEFVEAIKRYVLDIEPKESKLKRFFKV